MCNSEGSDLFPVVKYIIGLLDPYGVSHSSRVCVLAMRLAVRLDIPHDSEEYRVIKVASDLHDIGKVGIPEYIRRLPGVYLPAERMIMEQHCEIGYNILHQVIGDFITEDVCLAVRDHHEDWNGTGYPRKLKGEEIHQAARIIRVPDFYDAVIEDRGYRRALTPVQALKLMSDTQIIKQWAEPRILREFISMISEDLNLADDRFVE